MQHRQYNHLNTAKNSTVKGIDVIVLSGVSTIDHSHLVLIRRRIMLAGCQ